MASRLIRIDASLDIKEARALLEKGLMDEYPGATIDTITITSYDQPKILFQKDGMVEAVEFRHRIKE